MEIFERTIPTGLQHGTVTVCMGEGVENHFEVTTFRIEGEYSDGRRPDEVFFVMNVEQDLARRDLTINAIAYDPVTQRITDPYGGVKDLMNGLIKAVGKPTVRFQEDGLRIMRVARFAARFGYAVDGDTFQGMKDSLDTLRKVSKERINDELCKTLMTSDPSFGLQLLQQCGALEIACPALTSHSLPILNKCQGELETRLAFLYASVPIPEVQGEMLSLKFSNKQIKKVIFLLDLLGKYNVFVQKDTALSYKSFMATVKNHAPEAWDQSLEQFILLTEALGLGSRRQLDKYYAEVVFSKREMQINGDDILAAGIPAGPRIKKALEECYLEILRHPEHNNKYHLLELVRQF